MLLADFVLYRFENGYKATTQNRLVYTAEFRCSLHKEMLRLTKECKTPLPSRIQHCDSARSQTLLLAEGEIELNSTITLDHPFSPHPCDTCIQADFHLSRPKGVQELIVKSAYIT
ncbi:hypothetical protein J6590_062169 [Homalodisca vitripennis]|nr:hypothetical protein J6590_062169 [Homalodisca vitripennis]